MAQPTQTSPPRAINPRHLGLTRRQSYDPLSTSKTSLSQSLSLGNLPSPTFGHMPAGQRSVPAVDLNRMLGGGSAFRSGPLGDGQRTPGGSLVVGAEIFGFGGPKGKDRWGDGVVNGEGSVGGDDDDAAASENAPGGWPTEFEQAVASANKDGARKNLHGLETSSADFTLSGLPRPMLKASGSSIDLHSSAFASANDVPIRAPSRPALGLAKSGLPLESTTPSAAAPSLSPGVNDVVPSGSLSLATPPSVGDAASTAAPALYSSYSGYESPAAGEYFSQGFATGGYPRNGGRQQPASFNGGFDGFAAAGPPQLSPDDLAFGMQGMNLNGASGSDGYRNRQQPNQRPAFSPAGYGRDGSAPPTRQGSGGYANYFASPYMAQQDPYTSSGYGDPSGFFQPQGDVNGGPVRRDSGYAPSSSPPTLPSSPAFAPHPYAYPPLRSSQQQPWNLPHGSDYSPSALPSRHGSFSYSPALSHQPSLPYGLAPGAAFGGSPLEQGTPVFQAAQLGQQHQIILGRGLRSSADYVAPGPMHQTAYPVYGGGYGHGYGAAETMGRALRSATLEEFRTSRHRIWELSDIIGHVVEFSGDQLGSRHIQTKLETASAEEKAQVFEEILPNMLQLSTDVFANYVIQKFFEQGNQLQKTAMANVLEGHVLQLSLQMYGCRVVQKALEYVLVDQQVRLVKELDGHILKCARDAQSNHVVQRALERVPSDKITFITDACVGQVHALATHPYGCRVLQRIFENCPSSQTRGLLEELHRYTQNLIQDQYGNYVIQWVIEKGEKADRSLVISKIYGQVLPLAQQKFASNVIEKCVLHADDEERKHMIEEVLALGPDGSSVVKAMLVHPYANYVMQKILHTAVGAQREALFNETAVQLANLRKYSSTYSKHLITIEKLLASERSRIPY